MKVNEGVDASSRRVQREKRNSWPHHSLWIAGKAAQRIGKILIHLLRHVGRYKLRIIRRMM